VNHADHVNLIRPAGLGAGGIWADLGAGTGAFTLALREVIGPEAEIHAVDKDAGSLRELERQFEKRFGTHAVDVMQADLSGPLTLPPLDGVLMANSLHFFRDRIAMLKRAHSLLRPGGCLVLVEYNVDRGNAWVPFPLSFPTFVREAIQAGFEEPRLAATHPSSFLREFYSALARRT
jgi:ubiquinone/menaquinone biosynthesis C-methylase UbiE